jgi:hypothetical protein
MEWVQQSGWVGLSSFRDTHLCVGPESITTVAWFCTNTATGVMDSLMRNCASKLARFSRAPE